jgi:hypothetical protein
MGRALLVLETPQDRQKAISWINKAPVGTRVEFKASKRSLPQNDRLWAMLTDVQAHMKRKGVDYNTDQWKVIFLHAWGKEVEFLPGLDGKTFVPYGQSSSDLSKDEMTSLIEFMMAWGAEQGVTFHDPKQPNSDGAPDASRSDDAAPSPSASSEPADDPAPSAGSTSSEGELSPADRSLLIRCYGKLLAINEEPDLDVEAKEKILNAAKDDWKAELPEHLHKHLKSFFYSALGVIRGHDKRKAAKEYAGFLECAVEELIGDDHG